MLGKTICPKCSAPVQAGKRAENHMKRCEELPTGEEMAKRLDEEPLLSLTQLVKELNIHIGRIRDIIVTAGTHWDAEALKQRGIDNRYLPQRGVKRPNRRKALKSEGKFECNRCGMLVTAPGTSCQFCWQEENGLRTHVDFMRMTKDDPRWSLVQNHPQKPASM